MQFIISNIMPIILALFSGLMLFWSFFGNRIRGIQEVDHVAALQLINHKNALVLDVRENKEYQDAHLLDAMLIPLGKLGERIGELEKYRERPVVVVCRSGNRSAPACAMLGKRGFTQVYALAGGMLAWQKANLPVERQPAEKGKKKKMMAKILMYSTAVCPYCIRAEQLLRSKGVTEIEKLRVDLQPQLSEEMIAKTGRRTVPQIYINGTHVGGYDDIAALDRAGKLDELLAG